MSRPPVFIVPDGLKLPINTEASLFARLDSDEAYLLEQYPEIDAVRWRLTVMTDTHKAAEQWAIKVLDMLRALRKALQDASTPAWRAAALGMTFQEVVLTYHQPVIDSARGRAHRKGKSGRTADDDLCMAVLDELARGGLSLSKALGRMHALAGAWDEIAGVQIEHDPESLSGDPEKMVFVFRQQVGDEPERVQRFAVSTIKRHKWKKAEKGG